MTEPNDDNDLYVAGFAGNDQLDTSETLTGDNTQDPNDVGYVPPDRGPKRWMGDTEEETREGEPLDARLAEEEPDVSESDLDIADEEPRAGRLMSTTSGSLEELDDELAVDVGRDAQAASAEEAAVHVIDDDES